VVEGVAETKQAQWQEVLVAGPLYQQVQLLLQIKVRKITDMEAMELLEMMDLVARGGVVVVAAARVALVTLAPMAQLLAEVD
jgi:hypothetical protein